MITAFEMRKLGAVKGDFFIPSYQRGYRWGEKEVRRLLDDIYQNIGNNYCLQPIVVRKDDDVYRVVDGQQRLTTLYLIKKFLHEESRGFIEAPFFTISYETRPKSRNFLESSSEEMLRDANTNVDFFFMNNSYRVIAEWFDNLPENSSKSDLMSKMSSQLNENVSVIWYEIGPDEDERKLFTRLNIGKIPLTSAELTKAMFLSQTAQHNISYEKQQEIALQWDNIEKELHDESLWYFLTNNSGSNYQTRINLILDLVASSLDDEANNINDPYYTFFVFDAQNKDELEELWGRIVEVFSRLKDWHEEHTLYHKIGYLIAAGQESLKSIYDISEGLSKSEFKDSLDDKIRRSISTRESLDELAYDSNYYLIQNILLLFNVESVRQNGEQTQWFPFEKYKSQNWSLEHIHAQKTDTMSYKQEVWHEWLILHKKSLETLFGEKRMTPEHKQLLDDIEKGINGTIDNKTFNELRDKIIDCLSSDSDEEYIHTISNLALLNTSDNSALSNSAFDVKRDKIIEMDKTGKFIPFCTKMVFLKYYTNSDKNQIHFWGEDDRRGYMEHMKRVLRNYLPQEEE